MAALAWLVKDSAVFGVWVHMGPVVHGSYMTLG